MRPFRSCPLTPPRSSARSLLLAALCAGCSPSPEEPPLAGGLRMPGTEDAACRHDAGFSISPDGRWLAFETLDSSPVEPRFAILDLALETRREVEIAPEVRRRAAQGRGPRAATACWSADASRLYFLGHGASFAVAPGSGAPRMAPAPASDCAVTRPPGENFEVRRPAPRAVEILRGDTPIAIHRSDRSGVTRLAVEHPAPSPDGRWLAYVVRELRGSFTVRAIGGAPLDGAASG